jgi:ankyrin repeat protein
MGMGSSRMGRALFLTFVGLLLIVIYNNYRRKLYRQAPLRFYHAAISGNTEEMAAILDHHLVRLDQQPLGVPGRGYHIIRTLGEETLVGSVCEFNSDSTEIGPIRFLLDHGVSVNTRAEDGASILNEALIYQNPACALLLLERGANVHLDDHFPHGTPLMAAISDSGRGQEAIEVVRLLLAKGVDVNRANANGSTPLIWAAEAGNVDLARELIAHGANVNAQDGFGQTALILATQHKYEGIVRLLLAHNASVSIGKGRFGNALQTAKTRRSTQIIHLLMQAANTPERQ